MITSNHKSHDFYMEQALLQAEKAYNKHEVPIGAVIVDATGTIIATGYNQVEEKKSQTAHAELCALQQATQHVDDWRLTNCTLYVTLEPCLMCFGALRLSRIQAVYYGAPSSLFGFRLDSNAFLSLYNKDTFFIRGGIKEQECKNILKKFFDQKRKEKHNDKQKKES